MILDAALDGRLALVTSPMLIAERSIRSYVVRGCGGICLSIAKAERFTSDFADQTECTQEAPSPFPAVCRDVADDYLVALALHAGVEAIVTGDLDLLELGHPDVRVLTPRRFSKRFLASQ